MNNKSKKDLTSLEEYYWDILSCGNVPYLEAGPGTAKTAIYKSIAEKLNLQYFDIRLGSSDETDLSFPYLREVDGMKILSVAPPEWAYLANQSIKEGYSGALIVFEELNRCRTAIRDAALGPLLEKTIGYKFKFEPHVYMGSCGNIGVKDGCDVQEFDAALNTRLVHIKHKLTIPYWINNFAEENIIPEIVRFIKNNSSFFNKASGEEKAMANARTWTFLSNYISSKRKRLSNKYNINEVINDVIEHGSDMIGSAAAQKFATYLQETSKVSAKDILENFKSVKSVIEGWSKEGNRMRISELVNDINSKKMDEYNKKELENISDFFQYVEADSIGAFFWENISILEPNIKNHPVYGEICTRYEDIIKKLIKSLKE